MLGSRFTWAGLLVLLAAPAAVADDWPEWLGPRRDGVWRETGILDRFPKGGPPVRWRAKVGAGYGGPAVADGRVYVLDRVLAAGQKQPANPFNRSKTTGKERVLCLDEKDGKPLWTHEYDCFYTISYGSGPRTTPLVRGGKVYTLGAEGHLLCLGARKGDVLWSHDLKKEYGVEAPVWGFSAHPFLDGKKLICMVGGKGSTVVAFDKDSGKELWKALSASQPGYCPPILYEAGGKRQLITWDADAIHSLDPETGKVYWTQDLAPNFGMAIAAPQKLGDYLFATSYNGKAMMLKLERDRPAAKVLWRGKRDTGLYSTFATPHLEDGYIYGVCSRGEFRCVRADTGARVWESLEPVGGAKEQWGNVFAVKNGDRFFLHNEKGDLIIARLSPKGYTEVSRARLLEPTSNAGGRQVVWSHPAFANRCVYARNDKELVCASLAK
jgi:outer membrane protein assembly factor BamB